MRISTVKKTILAAAFLSLVFLGACQTLRQVLKEPVLSVNSVELVNIGFTGVDLLCKVKVENPNAFAIPFPETNWELFVNANSFINGTIKNDNFIKALESTVVEIPLGMNYLEVFKTFQSLKGANQAVYKIALDLKFDIPLLGEKIWHLEHDGNIPLITIPSVGFKGIAVKNIGLNRLDFEINWEVENNNIFAVNVKELAYNLDVNKSRWASGKMPDVLLVEPGKKAQMAVPFSINGLAMVKSITEIITRGSDIAVSCRADLSLGGDLPGIKDFSLPWDFSGETRLRR